MRTSGQYYLPILTADPINPQIIESTDIGLLLLKDCFNRDNLYVSGLGGKSLLIGPNFIWSNNRLNAIEYSSPGRDPITGVYSCPTGAIILSEDSFISGTSYSTIFGGFRNLITRSKPYASGEIPDTTNSIFNCIYSQAYDSDHSSLYNCYNSMLLSTTGTVIINSSGSTIDKGNVNSVLINATNKFIEGGRQGVVLIADGEETQQLFSDSRTLNLLFANGIRMYPRINISTDPSYDYINVKDSLDQRVWSSGLYHVVMSGNSGSFDGPGLIREWDISHFYTVPNKYSDLTIGTANYSPLYYDVTGMSPMWGNNTAFRHLTENVLVGHNNRGKNKSLIFGIDNEVVSQATERAELSILNKEAFLNPADKNVCVIGFKNYVTGSDSFIFGQGNLILGGLNNNIVIGVRNALLQESGSFSVRGDGRIAMDAVTECAPQARETVYLGFNNIENIGSKSVLIGRYNNTALRNSALIGDNNLVSGAFNNIFGSKNLVQLGENCLFGMNNQILGVQNLVLGQNNNLQSYAYGLLTGRQNNFAEWNIVIGNHNETLCSSSTVIGQNNNLVSAESTGTNQQLVLLKHPIKNFVLGDNNSVDGEDNYVAGSESWLQATGAVILGKSQTSDNSNNTVLIGNTNQAYNANNAVILGRNNRALKSNSLVLGENGRSINSNEVVIASGPFYNKSIAQSTQLAWKGVTTGNYLKSIYLDGKEINVNAEQLDGMAIVQTGSLLNGRLNLLAASDRYSQNGKLAARTYNVTLQNRNNAVQINNFSLANSYNTAGAESWGIGLTGYGPTGLVMVVSGTANDNIYWHVVGEFNQINPQVFTSGFERFVDVPQGAGIDGTLSFNKLVTV